MGLNQIFNDADIIITSCQPVHGGDINEAYCLYGDEKKYFLKVNDANRFPLMFEKEMNGLNTLREYSTFTIPKVIQCGNVQTRQYLLLEWIEKGQAGKDCWLHFGSGLAMLHKQPQPFFGFTEDNFIGSLVQYNPSHPTWHSFYAECRVMPLVKILFDAGSFSIEDTRNIELFCKRIPTLFPSEPPALLHGDLWGGNFMIAKGGPVAIFDPAVYFGHREMDIGMTRLFGGFDRTFYEAYNETFPLDKGWQQRLPFTQLYPILVHAVLFGGHYVSNAKGIINQFSK